MRCRHCEDFLSPSNVSRAYDSHQSACRALKRQKVQQAFFPKAAQTEKAIEALAMFFYTTETPFHKVGSEFLQQAFMLLGCKIPARRELAGKYLEAAYQLVKARVDKELHVAVGATALLMALATDGWRKRAAAQGAPLVNAMLLMPNGGSIFLKVLITAGMCKNAKWVVEQHVELAMEVTSGNPERLVGVIMDNTKTNLSALKQLQERYPMWLCLGCFAHGLALLIKDLGGLNKKQHAPGVAAILTAANTMANCINDCSAVRTLLTECQMAVLNNTLAVDVNVPTRFATLYFVLASILKSERAIKAMLLDEKWDETKKHSVNSAVFDQCRGDFWSKALKVKQLIEPICDAIHQVEADRPLLSQLLRIYNTLIEHARAWAGRADVPGALSRGVVAAVERRFQLHYDTSWSASLVLDPLFAEPDADGVGGWHMPFGELTGSQYQDAKSCIVRLVGQEHEKAVLAELTRLRLGALPDSMAEALDYITTRSEDSKQVVSIESRKKWWNLDKAFPLLSRAAERLLSMHATTCATERNWSTFRACLRQGVQPAGDRQGGEASVYQG